MLETTDFLVQGLMCRQRVEREVLGILAGEIGLLE